MVDGRLIITGHNGFVGKRLVQMADLQGFKVRTVEGNLLDELIIKKLSDNISDKDVLVHLAGGFFGSEDEIIQKNASVSLMVSKILSKKPNVKVIISSTGAVYGNSGADPINESTSLNPNTLYGLAKKWGEEAFKMQMKHPLKKLTIFRLPSLYGPNNELGVIARWIDSIKKTKGIILHGSGDQKRSFLHVDDLCNAILANAQSDIVGTFNLSEFDYFSLADIVQVLKSHTSVNVKVVPAENSLESMILDPELYCSMTGWRPSHNVNDFIGSHFD